MIVNPQDDVAVNEHFITSWYPTNATEKEIEFRDPIIEKVVDQLVSRSDVGFKKYNVTLDGDNSSLLTWLQHLQEELLDAANYVEKIKQVLNND